MRKASESMSNPPSVWLQALIVTAALSAVGVAVFLDSRSSRETKDIATEQFNRQELILARSAVIGIEGYYRELREALASLAEVPAVQQMTPECLTCMQHTYWGFPPQTSLRLLDSNGFLRFIYPFDGWRAELIGRDYSHEAFFQEAKATGSVSVSGLIINEQGDTRIRIAVPVHLTHKTDTVRFGDKTGAIAVPIDPDAPQFGAFQGVLAGSFDPQTIADAFIYPIVSGETGYAWLLNDEGVFLAHREQAFTGLNAFEVRAQRNSEISYQAVEEIQRRMMAGEEGTDRYISGWHRGQTGVIEKAVAYAPIHIEGKTWSVAVCAPLSEVEEIIHTARHSAQYTFGFVIVALIAGGLCLLVISHRWSHVLEREVAERTKELRETSDYLSKLIRHANAPIIVWNPDKQITIFNKAFEEMSGRTEAEMMKQPLDVLFPEESRSSALQKIESASRGEYWETVEIPILRRDGETRFGLWNSANIYGEDGKTLIATVAQGQDITERKRAEEERRGLEAQMQHTQKLESLGVLAGGIAHDFNNLLMVILGNADMALQDLSEVSPARPCIEEVEKASRRAADLTRQMLAYSGKGRFVIKAVDLSEVVEEMAHLLKSSISKKVTLKMNLERGLPAIEADIGQLQQVVMNLITNASEAFGEGEDGLVTMATGMMECSREYLGRSCLPEQPPEGNYVFVEVSDTGCGMDDETRERLFDPFFTTKFTGRGLGMSAVLGIVRGHKGAIIVDSEPGQGTTVKVLFLALDEQAEEPLEEGKSRDAEEWRGSGTILLVDDEEAIRKLATHMLERMGFNVRVASDGREAVDVFRKHSSEIVCVLLDLSMPHMNGEQAFQELRRIKADVRVILSSGYAEADIESRFAGQGIAGFIQKPYTSANLKAKAKKVVPPKNSCSDMMY